jgi:predicted dehydrogenase
MIRVGVVGSGFWAGMVHLPVLQRVADFEVIGVASASYAKAQAAATKFRLPHAYHDYFELLQDPSIDVVDICAPNYLHAEIALAALERGKDVICIKPLATSLDDAITMVEAAESAGRKLFYAENVPFIPALCRLKELTVSEVYGQIFRVKACQGIGRLHADWFSDPRRSGGGCIIDMAVHGFAFLQWFAGEHEAVRVTTEAGTFVHSCLVEDTSATLVRFADGMIGQTEDSWSLTGGFDSRFEVFGTKGHALVDLLYSYPIRSVLGGSAEGAASTITYNPIDDHFVKDGHLAMFQHFRDCLLRNQSGRSSGEEGLRTMRLVDAAYRSVREKRSIDLTYQQQKVA